MTRKPLRTARRREALPQALPGADIAAGLRPLLTGWLGAGEWQLWQDRLSEVPLANRMFLELHLADGSRSCDIVTSITAGDGSLAAWTSEAARRTGMIWQKSARLLEAWRAELAAGQGALRDLCLMMWFEFDLHPGETMLGEPSLFIALAPGADIRALAGALGPFPEWQAALQRFAGMTVGDGRRAAFAADGLVLGHIGYMAGRQGDNEILPLRSCWRCDDFDHLNWLLTLAAIPVEYRCFANEFLRLIALLSRGNSLMLDLDSQARFLDGFAVEINLFRRDLDDAKRQSAEVLRILRILGHITPEQALRLERLTDRAVTPSGRWIYCLLHHVKIRFHQSRAVEVKLYWLTRVTDHQPRVEPAVGRKPEKEQSWTATVPTEMEQRC